jgi:hypothetical protein
LAQVLILLAIAQQAEARHWDTSFQLLVSIGTSAGCALFYMAGVVVLLTRDLMAWEIAGVGLFGASCLGLLVWVERWAIGRDTERRSKAMVTSE